MRDEDRVSDQKRIAAIVLAAGKSERMRYPKSLLIFGKETAIDRVIRICAEAGCDPVLVVLGHEAERVRQNASLHAGVLLHNDDYESGRTSSLQTGLRALPPDAAGFVIFPVDQPLVEVATVASLVSAYQEGGGSVLVPVHDGRKGHPVLCDRALAAEFLALAPDAPARLVTGADPDRVVGVETDDLEIFEDLDEPADYHRALEVYSARGGEAGFLAPKGAGRPAPKKPPA
jgi:CTP:molybdopterin cytidylyltransferase MocA